MKALTKKEYDKMKAWGVLTSIDLYGCDGKMIRSAKEIKRYVEKLCGLIKMKRFGKTQCVRFGKDPKVTGYSMTQFIETSLISGHFAENSNAVYIDIFSCQYYDQLVAANFTKKFFKAKKSNFSVLVRK